MAPSPAPHDRPSYNESPSGAAPRSSPPARASASNTPNQPAQRTGSGSPKSGGPPKSSPLSSRREPGVPPKIIVKKEPTSPDAPTPRHRPRKLDLSKNTTGANPMSARPLTSRESGLGIQDVGLACLSPGFVTQDPTMREQLQRSISVREQQRQLIESRLQQTAKPGDAPSDSAKDGSMPGPGGMKTPATSRRKAPPGLSIVAPSHEQFAHERVIQSAPLGQSFTGLRGHHGHPLSRHIANQPSNLSNTSHIHHVPATQTANRLPPITDVFASEGLGQHREPGPPRTTFFQNNSASTPGGGGGPNQPPSLQTRPSFPSPGHPSSGLPPQSARGERPREYRSAEDAQAELAGGRPELLPKLVHYGSSHQQPPTPPSPIMGGGGAPNGAGIRMSGGARRRGRDEYEDGVSPPLGNGPAPSRRAHFEGEMYERGYGRLGEREEADVNSMSPGQKRDEFMRLCARAWDLFHS